MEAEQQAEASSKLEKPPPREGERGADAAEGKAKPKPRRYKRYDRGQSGLFPAVEEATVKAALAVVAKLGAPASAGAAHHPSVAIQERIVELIGCYCAKRRRESAIGDPGFRRDLEPLAKALAKLDAELAASPKALRSALDNETAIRRRQPLRELSGQIDAFHELVGIYRKTTELLNLEKSVAGRPMNEALIDACGKAIAIFEAATASRFPQSLKIWKNHSDGRAFSSKPAHFVFELLRAVEPTVDVRQVKSALEAILSSRLN